MFLTPTPGLPCGSDGKASALQCGRPRFDPWVGKIPWRRKWQRTSVLLPGEFRGLRSLVGYSPWSHKESDTTEQLHFPGLLYKRSLCNSLGRKEVCRKLKNCFSRNVNPSSGDLNFFFAYFWKKYASPLAWG